MGFIPLSYHPIDPDGLGRVLRQYEHKHHNDIIRDFEQKLKEITGGRYVVALNSGTAAIHLALKALGVNAGDEVLVSTFTYVATVNPIVYQGGIPVFVDSERDTWNMDPALLETAVKDRLSKGRKPKALLLVHAYGMPSKMKEITAIADRYEIPVIEDAAEALGSVYSGQHVGTTGKLGVLSFNNNKIVTTYGGGALLTDDRAVAEKVLFWATQSRDNFPYYHHSEIGFNYRIGPLNAAAGICQLETLQEGIEQRRMVFRHFSEVLGTKGWLFCHELPGFFCNRWLTTAIAPDGKNALTLMEVMARQNIELRLLWNPMHVQPVFREFPAYVNGVSEHLFQKGLSFPSGDMEAARKICNIIDTNF